MAPDRLPTCRPSQRVIWDKATNFGKSIMSYRIGLPLWKTAARRGVTITIPVDIFFDEEAKVYFATSEHLSGLAVEAQTLDELRSEVRAAIDELLEIEVGHPGGCPPLSGQAMAKPTFNFQDQVVVVA